MNPYSNLNDLQLHRIQAAQMDDIAINIEHIAKQLKRIANILESTDKKTKEQMLDKS